MTLSESDKDYIIDQLDRLDQQRLRAVLISEDAFVAWLRVAAYWIFEKIIDIIGKVFQWAVLRFFN